jgi:hypothetical protein
MLLSHAATLLPQVAPAAKNFPIYTTQHPKKTQEQYEEVQKYSMPIIIIYLEG